MVHPPKQNTFFTSALSYSLLNLSNLQHGLNLPLELVSSDKIPCSDLVTLKFVYDTGKVRVSSCGHSDVVDGINKLGTVTNS